MCLFTAKQGDDYHTPHLTPHPQLLCNISPTENKENQNHQESWRAGCILERRMMVAFCHRHIAPWLKQEHSRKLWGRKRVNSVRANMPRHGKGQDRTGQDRTGQDRWYQNRPFSMVSISADITTLETFECRGDLGSRTQVIATRTQELKSKRLTASFLNPYLTVFLSAFTGCGTLRTIELHCRMMQCRV